MRTAPFWDSLLQQGIEVWAEGEHLRYRAPRGVLTPDLRAELAKRKTEILDLLRQRGLGQVNVQLPQIQPAPEQRYELFPLNDMQQAYWVGRSNSFAVGDVAAHAYIELECVDADMARLECAWQRMIDRHDALRLVVTPEGQQRILERVPSYSIKVNDWRSFGSEALQSKLEELRWSMSHQVLAVDQWPLFDICATRLDDRHTRLHISIDGLIADAWSLSIILKEWGLFYQDHPSSLVPLEISFRDYVLAEIAFQDSALYQRSLDYWKNRLASLPPPPDLPLVKSPTSLARPRFTSRSRQVPSETWRRLKVRASQAGLTSSGLLLAIYAEVLATWSKSQRFTISVPRFNRLPVHPQVDDIVGELASFTLVEVDASTQDTFETRARRIQMQLMQGLEYQHISGVRILRELSRLHRRTTGAVMPVVLTTTLYQVSHRYGSLFDSARDLGKMLYTINQTPQVWADLQVSERGEDLFLYWEAVEELFPPKLLDDMFDAYAHLVQQLADEDETWQKATRLVPSVQIARWEAINSKQAPIPDKLLHTLFEEQVQQRPYQVAVIAAGRELSYEEMHKRSNQIGHLLRNLGARPNKLVAVVMEKGWEQVVAVLGIHKAGAAYMPIDVNLPKERIKYLLEDGQVELVLTQSWLDEDLTWPKHVRRLCVDKDWATPDTCSLQPVQGIDDLAYVIYTSGSTGQPKGVMITQRSVLNMLACTNSQFRVTPHDRVLALTALHHDLSVYDIFGTLASGGTIVIPDAAAIRDPAHWAKLMSRERVTIWDSVPTFMEMLVEYLEHTDGSQVRIDALRLAFLGGDWLPVTLPNRIRALAPSAQVVSVGGPTETCVWNIWYIIDRVDPNWKSIPYGQPIANVRYYILNEALECCPVWVPGEMYCAGVSLATGYWRNEKQTRTSFIIHPRTGERLYRTGDLGRYLPDGNIEILGREDFQVKIQGQRIELGEIEVTLAQHPAIKSAVVQAIGKPGGRKRLVGYLVPSGESKLTTDDIPGYLKDKLPEYMIPSAYVIMEALPLTPNGKTDRSALPDPDLLSSEPEVFAAARDPVEKELANMLISLLGIEQMGIYDNFLELGGNSLIAVQFAARIRDSFHIDLPLSLLLGSTVAELAVEIANSQVSEADRELVAQLLKELESISEDEARTLLKESSFHSDFDSTDKVFI